MVGRTTRSATTRSSTATKPPSAPAPTKTSNAKRTKETGKKQASAISPNVGIKRKRTNADADADEPAVEEKTGKVKKEATKATPAKKAKVAKKSQAGPDLSAGAEVAKKLFGASAAANSSGEAKDNPYNLTPGASPYPAYERPTPEECQHVNDILVAVHGKVNVPKAVPPPNMESSGCGEVPSVLDALVRTRLSAATNGNNSSRAFRGIVETFGTISDGEYQAVDWNKVRQAPQKDLFEAIKTGGLADVKSRDIQKILQLVYEENQEQAQKDGQPAKKGSKDKTIISLDHLHNMSSDDAFNKLLSYPGIGPKTASCVLLFCMQRPSFAVDTHVFRLVSWLGWVPSDSAVRRMGKEAKSAAASKIEGDVKIEEDDGETPKQPSKSPKKVKVKVPPPVTRNSTYSHLDVRIPDALKYPLHYLFIRHGKTCPSCMAKVDGKAKEAWGKKKCPLAALKVSKGKGTGAAKLKKEQEVSGDVMMNSDEEDEDGDEVEGVKDEDDDEVEDVKVEDDAEDDD